MNSLENKLSAILGARLLSISKVHDDTGISRSTLTNLYYRRIDNVGLDTLRKLCDYLQIPLSELIEYTPKELTKEV
ncbi:helix-turn-helix domain-containing protein [Levilactobacillus brevis]|uniref:helix-turn-helix domain-containing protein n=1 Tax=Levilactobacillus brevis TaxID=1580 RepID=UPI00288BC391|nr:helix-turn-helix transcriptional regulator [Levilactobacillus brevis]